MSFPPYDITPKILKLCTGIAQKIGEVNAAFLVKPTTKLRKQNQIKTIHSSLKIEGNTLSEHQITALIEGKRILGPQKDILEVQNAIEVYDQIEAFNPRSEKSFLLAHNMLMKELLPFAGQYRKKGVGIVKGNKVEHMAPPANLVPNQMKSLFAYLKKSEEIALIKSCVFHYEMEFIHPFSDGNGRMGRLWQSVILSEEHPLFYFLPFETLVAANQEAYYKALSLSDKHGKSTIFIEFMLGIINAALEHKLASTKSVQWSQEERLQFFIANRSGNFKRADYLEAFKHLSTATASRDLKKGIELGLFSKTGEKNKTVYRLKKLS